MRLMDLEFNCYHFYARKTQFNNEESSLWKEFEPHLQSAVDKIGGIRNISQETIVNPTPRHGFFVPIATSQRGQSEFIEIDGYHRKLISGVYLDVYIIQERVAVEAEIQSLETLRETTADLVSKLPQNPESSIRYAAESFCYFSELEQIDEQPGEIFEELLKTKDYGHVELSHCFYAIILGENRADAVILSKNYAGQEAKNNASKMLDVLLQEYFLSFAKIVNEVISIDEVGASSTRENLTVYLYELAEKPPKTLSAIEKANRKLSQLRAELAGQIQTIESHLHTILINIRNAEKILDNSLLEEKKEELHKIMVKPLDSKSEQIQSNLGYLKITAEISKIKAEEIANLSTLQAGIWGRKITLLFGFLSVLGLLQVFPENQSPADFWNKAGILVVLASLMILVIFGREFLGNIFKTTKEETRTPKEKESIKYNSKPALAPMSAKTETKRDETAKTAKDETTENK